MRRAILSQPIHPIKDYEEMLTDEKLGAFELYRDKKPKKPHGTGLAIAAFFLCIGILAALGAWWR